LEAHFLCAMLQLAAMWKPISIEQALQLIQPILKIPSFHGRKQTYSEVLQMRKLNISISIENFQEKVP
jgi:hypothetical protein